MEEEPRPFPQTPEEWVDEALFRMKEEIACCEDHIKDEEFANIVMHMTNIALGAKLTAETIVERILSTDQIISLMQAKLEESFGNPVQYVGEAGGVMGFELLPIEVPDDASGLEGSGNE